MPYRGKPSKNCADCRRRKIKCDLKVPGCTQCRNAGFECSGYRNHLDLMFLDENERTERSVLKRSKSSSRKTPSDTSSAPSRRSSPTLSTIADNSGTSRKASVPSMARRSPSVGPPRTTRAGDRRKSRTTTPEEGGRTGARSRAALKAALRRTVSAQQSSSRDFLQPFDRSNHSLQQQQQPQHEFASETPPAGTNSDFLQGYELRFDVGSTINIGNPYSQGSSNASVPSISTPLHFENMHLSEPLSFALPMSQPLMSFSMPASGQQVPFYPPHSPFQNFQQQQVRHQQPQRAITFQPCTGFEQQWDCGQWVHDVHPALYSGMSTPQLPLPSDEEWLQWQWGGSSQQQKSHEEEQQHSQQ